MLVGRARRLRRREAGVAYGWRAGDTEQRSATEKAEETTTRSGHAKTTRVMGERESRLLSRRGETAGRTVARGNGQLIGWNAQLIFPCPIHWLSQRSSLSMRCTWFHEPLMLCGIPSYWMTLAGTPFLRSATNICSASEYGTR